MDVARSRYAVIHCPRASQRLLIERLEGLDGSLKLGALPEHLSTGCVLALVKIVHFGEHAIRKRLVVNSAGSLLADQIILGDNVESFGVAVHTPRQKLLANQREVEARTNFGKLFVAAGFVQNADASAKRASRDSFPVGGEKDPAFCSGGAKRHGELLSSQRHPSLLFGLAALRPASCPRLPCSDSSPTFIVDAGNIGEI
mmetsp:Transcript_20668/g.58814  ORF Transcript_20668/g.58814 Transcript_20668/m.58814 type:complete len:200 (-) Transcript_20668:1472-2071(-)